MQRRCIMQMERPDMRRDLRRPPQHRDRQLQPVRLMRQQAIEMQRIRLAGCARENLLIELLRLRQAIRLMVLQRRLERGSQRIRLHSWEGEAPAEPLWES